MNQDDKPSGSLADQAANWVPPWARPKPEAQPQSFPDLQWQSDSDEEPTPEEPSAAAAPSEPTPAADEPLANEPTANEPTANEPTANEPTADEPTADEPTANEPTANEPTAEESITAEEPVAEELTTVDEPGADEDPGADEIGAEVPSAEEPVADEFGAEMFVVGEAIAEGGVAEGGGAPERVAEGAGVVQALPGIDAGTGGDGAGAEPVPAPVMTDSELRGAVEAILLVVDEPTSEVTLAQVLEQPVDRVLAALEAASMQYSQLGFGFDLRRVAGGWRLYTRPEYAAYVEKFVLDGQQIRLTQAALETLAVIAYKQPVTRSRISAIRGVNCDGVVRTLVTRGLIEETGSEPESGAFLYRTTTLFLEKLGLNSVDQLPPLAPFLPDDIDEIADAQR